MPASVDKGLIAKCVSVHDYTQSCLNHHLICPVNSIWIFIWRKNLRKSRFILILLKSQRLSPITNPGSFLCLVWCWFRKKELAMLNKAFCSLQKNFLDVKNIVNVGENIVFFDHRSAGKREHVYSWFCREKEELWS